LSFTGTAGTRNDCTQAETVIDKIRVTRPGPRRPRVRPERVVADKGYSARSFRAYLRRTRRDPTSHTKIIPCWGSSGRRLAESGGATQLRRQESVDA
jgi:hypothetical protein